MSVDFRNIRSLRGSQHQAFEELCAQLAREEIPDGAQFYRTAPPDAGMDCYAVLPNGDLWGWQAKYFHGLDASQWRQIDESVKQTLEKHPRLVRYHVCVPLDRTHAQIKKWEQYVENWRQQPAGKGLSVEFIWWGEHELQVRLSEARHAGRVRYFFDTQRFGAEWFRERLEEAKRAAGPRYTPEIHVDLPLTWWFEAFGRTECFFNEVKAQAESVEKALSEVKYAISRLSGIDSDITSPTSELIDNVQQIVEGLKCISPHPAAPSPFAGLIQQLEQSARRVTEILRDMQERNGGSVRQEEETGETRNRGASAEGVSRELQKAIGSLGDRLYILQQFFENAQRGSSASVLLLTGNAGTGKTHLLCDVAEKRMAKGLPTVLIMGQRFTSEDEPWTQALQQLDIRDVRVDEFVGALEAAAQAFGCRLLVVIDALNEGRGPSIWPEHLDAFLAPLEKSPWIGVVLAIRSSSEELVIPEATRTRAVKIVHQGFSDRTYDACRTFFTHYGIELPSTPVLNPEFNNPLFLKILCKGLSDVGERRLPRGLHGITAVFNLFLDAVNQRLARELDYDPKERLVHKAIDKLAEVLAQKEYLYLLRQEAREIVDSLLPNRDFNRSLFHGLIREGILMEETDSRDGEIILIAYERFADHLIVMHWLNQYPTPQQLKKAVRTNGVLGFLLEPVRPVRAGILEAMCIQIPERMKKELLELVPSLKSAWHIGDAFRQSLLWRDTRAFLDSTWTVFEELTKTKNDLYEALDILLTVAVIPEHPLNAEFLHQVLRQCSLPERDAWWSIYLHLAYAADQPGAVHRLIDWASAVAPEQNVEAEVVDLASTALAWMLTTSNRFLRDRATKALVSLLTGRLDATTRLVERFVDVDDPYVTERVYAVAYGVSMRSHDSEAVGKLAQCVYERVFQNGTPPVHILLRDYARGVIERALYLGAHIEVDVKKIRPPYQSTWHPIPTEEEIQTYLTHRNGREDGARDMIEFSVMDGDFALYVVGTNSGYNEWLSLRLDEPAWQSPEERLSALVADFSEAEKSAWQAFEAADDALGKALLPAVLRNIVVDWGNDREEGGAESSQDNQDVQVDMDLAEYPEDFPTHVTELQRRMEAAFNTLREVLTERHFQQLEEILTAKERQKEPPRLDLKIIQRYILKRVFELGWTTQLFGFFDRYTISHYGREARKPERIGKKYQWIAYHEIMAYISDHFQYRGYEYRGADRCYEGPWQAFLRDIDPSCTLHSVPGGTSWGGHAPAWWCPVRYDHWEAPRDPLEWVKTTDDLPKVDELLVVRCPKDDSQWVNLEGFFLWQQGFSDDPEITDDERHELWYKCIGYLVRGQDVIKFMEWAQEVDFWGQWMPEPPGIHTIFLGEYGWSPAFHHLSRVYGLGWARPEPRDGSPCPVEVNVASLHYVSDISSFDCSIDNGYTLHLPVADLIDGLGLRWTGSGADFINKSGQLVAFDPTAHEAGPDALLIRIDSLTEFLQRNELALCWTVIAEKRYLTLGSRAGSHGSLRMSGAYELRPEGAKGFLKHIPRGR